MTYGSEGASYNAPIPTTEFFYQFPQDKVNVNTAFGADPLARARTGEYLYPTEDNLTADFSGRIQNALFIHPEDEITRLINTVPTSDRERTVIQHRLAELNAPLPACAVEFVRPTLAALTENRVIGASDIVGDWEKWTGDFLRDERWYNDRDQPLMDEYLEFRENPHIRKPRQRVPDLRTVPEFEGIRRINPLPVDDVMDYSSHQAPYDGFPFAPDVRMTEPLPPNPGMVARQRLDETLVLTDPTLDPDYSGGVLDPDEPEWKQLLRKRRPSLVKVSEPKQAKTDSRVIRDMQNDQVERTSRLFDMIAHIGVRGYLSAKELASGEWEEFKSDNPLAKYRRKTQARDLPYSRKTQQTQTRDIPLPPEVTNGADIPLPSEITNDDDGIDVELEVTVKPDMAVLHAPVGGISVVKFEKLEQAKRLPVAADPTEQGENLPPPGIDTGPNTNLLGHLAASARGESLLYDPYTLVGEAPTIGAEGYINLVDEDGINQLDEVVEVNDWGRGQKFLVDDYDDIEEAKYAETEVTEMDTLGLLDLLKDSTQKCLDSWFNDLETQIQALNNLDPADRGAMAELATANDLLYQRTSQEIDAMHNEYIAFRQAHPDASAPINNVQNALIVYYEQFQAKIRQVGQVINGAQGETDVDMSTVAADVQELKEEVMEHEETIKTVTRQGQQRVDAKAQSRENWLERRRIDPAISRRNARGQRTQRGRVEDPSDLGPSQDIDKQLTLIKESTKESLDLHFEVNEALSIINEAQQAPEDETLKAHADVQADWLASTFTDLATLPSAPPGSTDPPTLPAATSTVVRLATLAKEGVAQKRFNVEAMVKLNNESARVVENVQQVVTAQLCRPPNAFIDAPMLRNALEVAMRNVPVVNMLPMENMLGRMNARMATIQANTPPFDDMELTRRKVPFLTSGRRYRPEAVVPVPTLARKIRHSLKRAYPVDNPDSTITMQPAPPRLEQPDKKKVKGFIRLGTGDLL
jgi:hypothetical protein